MSFIYANIKNIGRDHAETPAMFSYYTSDTLAVVQQSGYFDDPKLSLSRGDLILVKASDSSALLIATDSSSAQVQTSGSGTGWSTYVDTQYVDSGTAFTVSADTDTVLPNNAGSVIEAQKPSDVITFYDGSVITGRNGDSLDIMIYFKAVPSSANQWLDMWIDIGGSIGELYRQTFSFPRGSGAERGILCGLPSAYTLNTWEANGGTVYVRSNAALDIYQINFNFDRSHRAV